MNLRALLVLIAISASALISQTTTIPGDLRVKKHARIDSLSNDSTMMVVADTLGRLSVLPIPGGSSNVPGDPTASLGLTAVNGVATTYMRSDAAPALSQAIVPTWTGAHIFNAGVTFGSTITTPLTASRLLTVNASSQLAVNAALTTNGFLYASGAGGIAATAAAGNGQILIGSTGVAPVLGTLSGTANQISVSQGAGTLGLSIPNILVVPDSLNVQALIGADTRMVVAGTDGGIFTQAIPSGVSPGNPTATIGLAAVNGSAATYLRSDGAPALSQAIIPTWTGAHTFSAGLSATTGAFTGIISSAEALSFTGNGTIVAGRIGRTAAGGLVLWGVTGSSYDLSIRNNAGDNLIQNPTGGSVTEFPRAGGVSITGPVTNIGLAGSGTRLVTATSAGLLGNATLVAGSYEWTGTHDFQNYVGFSGNGTAGDGRIYRGAASGLSLRGITGSSYDFGILSATSANYLIRNPTGTSNLEFPSGTMTVTDLSGSGTRMVVADASGVLSTQTIPAAGSLANPTATIGLTAVNGVATSGMRSDGAPALSQAIAPTWTGLHTFTLKTTVQDTLIATNYLLGRVRTVAGGSDFHIFPQTVNAGDTGRLYLSGGGGVHGMGPDRGAYFALYGNEYSLLPGQVQLSAGEAGGMTFSSADNLSLAYQLRAGDENYFIVNSTNASEAMVFGNSTTNPTYTFEGTGNTTIGGDLIGTASGFYIRSNTSDGSDTKHVQINGGGNTTTNSGRGASIDLYGNDHASEAGQMRFAIGSAAAAQYNFWMNNSNADAFLVRNASNNLFSIHAGTGKAAFAAAVSVAGNLEHAATVKLVDTVSSSTTIELPLNTSDLITVSLTHDATLTIAAGTATGRHITLRVHQDATGGRDITWGSEFEFPEGVAPTQNTAPDTWSYYSFIYNEINDTWDYIGGALGFGGS